MKLILNYGYIFQLGVLVALLVGPLVVTGGGTDYTNTICNSSNALNITETDHQSWENTVYNQMFYYMLGQAILATLVLPLTYSKLQVQNFLVTNITLCTLANTTQGVL